MDVGSGSGYPSSALSNFAGHRFAIDGVVCNSMEGFLQSLKFKNPEIQEEVCKLVGYAAKVRGKNKKWWKKQILYWRGKLVGRHTASYQVLLDRAYNEMFNQSESFRKALKASGEATIEHSLGKRQPARTVLTRTEFCSRLVGLRRKM